MCNNTYNNHSMLVNLYTHICIVIISASVVIMLSFVCVITISGSSRSRSRSGSGSRSSSSSSRGKCRRPVTVGRRPSDGERRVIWTCSTI